MTRAVDVDVQTVAAAQAGDEAAFGLLYDAYAAPIFNHVLRLVGQTPLAEDITHDVFVQAYRRLAQLEEAGAIRPWLYRIATNLALNALRRERREVPLMEEPARRPTSVVEALDRRQRVEQVLRRLPGDQVALLLLHLREGFSLQEVARLLGISYAAAKQRAYRARQAFIREYERLESAEGQS